jgi:hypothetical protein
MAFLFVLKSTRGTTDYVHCNSQWNKMLWKTAARKQNFEDKIQDDFNGSEDVNSNNRNTDAGLHTNIR